MAAAPLSGAGAQLADRPLLIEARVPKPPTLASGPAGDVLVYELHVTNLERQSITWTALDIADASTGVRLALLGDSALSRDIQRPAMGAVPFAQRMTLAAGLRAVLFVSVSVPASSAPPALRQSLTFKDSLGMRTLTLADLPVVREAAVLGPPLRGGPWLAANGPSNGSGHRRALLPIGGRPVIAQRFAIDYVLVDTAFATHKGDSLDNSRYYAHALDVLAVADGIVAAIKDSIPENVPGINSRAVPITLETVGGNHVVLELGGGRYAFYAHVRPGSIRVKLGERVKQGAVLAKLGNSGNSTEPHLHFHLADAIAPLGSEGLPYVHPSVEIVGACTTIGSGCRWTPPVRRSRIMPFANDLVRFP